jgi:lactate permease
MPTATQIGLGLLPLATITFLMIGRYWPATRAMPIAWVVAVAVGYVGWNMTPMWIAAASINGAITAINILWIVFGAILMLYTLKQTGAFDVISEGFTSISDDRRVQVVLLVFLMGSFIEAAAGFGTPAAIVGPLLVGLGFPPLAAVVVALTGNLMAITFGAVGTPLIIGLEDVFASSETISSAVAAQGMTVSEWVVQIGAWAATYHAIVGILLPFIGVAMMTRFFGEERSLKPALDVLPLTLFAWASFVVPYWLTAYFLGPMFPGLFGAMGGMVMTVGALRAGYFHPDEKWDFGPESQWPEHWVGDIAPGETMNQRTAVAADGGHVTPNEQSMSLIRAWAPYAVLAALLVLTRIIDPVKNFLTSTLVLKWSNILGTGMSNDIALLYLPGAMFVTVHILTILLHGMDSSEIKASWTETIGKITSPVIALLFAVAMVQIMIQSGQSAGIDSMLVVLSEATADAAGDVYPFFAALVGAFGAFIAGSNTVSDILFGTFQYHVAADLGVSKTIIVAAQTVGGAIGNLIAIHNVVAALAVVGLVGEEGRVIRLELIPLTYYAMMTGLLTLIFVYVLNLRIF